VSNAIQTKSSADLAWLREQTASIGDALASRDLSAEQRATLRRAMAVAPEMVDALGNVSLMLRDRITDGMAGDQKGLRFAISEWTEQLATDLGAEGASPLEKMLIDSLLVAYLQWQQVAWAHESIHRQGPSAGQGAYIERRLSAAQRRYLQAAESLARVRGLLRRLSPQVNVAHQMIVQNSG
jgi:hypothetical protein